MRGLFMVVVGLLVGAVMAPVATAAPPSEGEPSFDARSGDHAPVPASTRASRERLADRLGPQTSVVTDPVNGGVATILRADGLLSAPAKGSPKSIAVNWIRTHLNELGLSEADITALRLKSSSRANGATHFEFAQTANGIPSYDTSLQINVTRKGQVSSVGGGAVHALSPNRAKPVISAAQALARAQAKAGGARTSAAFEKSAPKLVVFASPDGDRLAWRLLVAGESPFFYDVVIDATDGSLLSRISLTDFADALVFQNHPGATSGGSGNQSSVDITGYLTAPGPTSILSGPYARAYADLNDNDTAQSGEQTQPSSGDDYNYTQAFQTAGSGQFCPFNFGGSTTCTWSGTLNSSRDTNRKQRTTQLFYFVSRFHDWLEDEVDFNTGDGNFEGNDAVEAQTDDGNADPVPDDPCYHVNNANMTTFPDGDAPTMQMYFFRGQPGCGSLPAVSSADDASVVLHEYTHGLSNRLIGDGGGLVARQSGAMGEGWSDWYALDYLEDRGFETDTAASGEIAVGEYVTNDSLRGIRSEALDCAVGSVAAACSPGPSSSAGPGGYTFGDMGRIGRAKGSTGPDTFEVHDDGELWAQTLWDLRTALGATTARQLITEGMRQLTTDDPSMLDARNAILAADQAIDGGSGHDEIWNVFAERGMGYAARTSTAESTRGIESADAPQLVEVASTSTDDSTPAPGESVELTVNLHNPALGDLTSTEGTLVADTPGVTIDDPAHDFGAIAGGAVEAAQFTVNIPPTAADVVDLHLDVTTNAGSVDDLHVAFPLNDGGHGSFQSTDVPKSIPDDSATGVTSSISVSNTHKFDSIGVCVDVLHTAVADLNAVLTSPSGTEVSLFESPGRGGGSIANNLTGVQLADRATNDIQTIPFTEATPAASGLFRPNEPLSNFADENPAGTWTLKLWDIYPLDSGALTRWSLLFDEASCPGPPLTTIFDPVPPAKPTFAAGPKSARLDRKGRFKFRFTAGPAGAKGSAGFKTAGKIKSGKSNPKVLTIGSKSFTVPANGRADLQLKMSATTFKKLKKKRKVATKVTVNIGGTMFATTLTLKR